MEIEKAMLNHHITKIILAQAGPPVMKYTPIYGE